MTQTHSGRYPRISKKAESFDAGYQKEPLLADLKKGRSFSIDKRMNPSPVVPHREHSVRKYHPLCGKLTIFLSSQNQEFEYTY